MGLIQSAESAPSGAAKSINADPSTKAGIAASTQADATGELVSSGAADAATALPCAAPGCAIGPLETHITARWDKHFAEPDGPTAQTAEAKTSLAPSLAEVKRNEAQQGDAQSAASPEAAPAPRLEEQTLFIARTPSTALPCSSPAATATVECASAEAKGTWPPGLSEDERMAWMRAARGLLSGDACSVQHAACTLGSSELLAYATAKMPAGPRLSEVEQLLTAAAAGAENLFMKLFPSKDDLGCHDTVSSAARVAVRRGHLALATRMCEMAPVPRGKHEEYRTVWFPLLEHAYNTGNVSLAERAWRACSVADCVGALPAVYAGGFEPLVRAARSKCGWQGLCTLPLPQRCIYEAARAGNWSLVFELLREGARADIAALGAARGGFGNLAERMLSLGQSADVTRAQVAHAAALTVAEGREPSCSQAQRLLASIAEQPAPLVKGPLSILIDPDLADAAAPTRIAAQRAKQTAAAADARFSAKETAWACRLANAEKSAALAETERARSNVAFVFEVKEPASAALDEFSRGMRRGALWGSVMVYAADDDEAAPVLDYAAFRGGRAWGEVLIAAARAGAVHNIETALLHGAQSTAYAARIAAEYEHLGVLERLIIADTRASTWAAAAPAQLFTVMSAKRASIVRFCRAAEDDANAIVLPTQTATLV